MEKINKHPTVGIDYGYLSGDLIAGDGIQTRAFNNSALKEEVKKMNWQEIYEQALYCQYVFDRTSGPDRGKMNDLRMIYCNVLLKLSKTVQQFYTVFSVSPPRSSIMNDAFLRWYELSSEQLKESTSEEEIAHAWELSPDGLLETCVDPHLRYYIFIKLKDLYPVDDLVPVVRDQKNTQISKTELNSGEVVDDVLNEEIVTLKEAKERYLGSESGSEISNYYMNLWIKWAESEEELYDILRHLPESDNPWKELVEAKLEMIQRIGLSD